MRIRHLRLVATLAAAALAATACTASVRGHGRVAGSSPSPGSTATTRTCRPVFFGVPGSGQGLQNPPPRELPAGLTQRDGDRYGGTIGLVKVALARQAGAQLAATEAVDYPAAPLVDFADPVRLLRILDASEATGADSLVAAIRRSEGSGCTGRPVLLAGYSQGAEVVIRAVDELTVDERAHVAVALFGNPSYVPDAVGDFRRNASGRGLRPAFGAVPYTLPADVRQRTIDICALADPVCDMPRTRTSLVQIIDYLTVNAHIHDGAYAGGADDLPGIAAAFLWQHR